jgi:hypothetical protein
MEIGDNVVSTFCDLCNDCNPDEDFHKTEQGCKVFLAARGKDGLPGPADARFRY